MTKTIAATSTAISPIFSSIICPIITPILALLWVGLFPVDVAAAGKARVGVVSLRGAGEGQVRGKITAVLKANGFQVVGTEQLESSASGLGVSLDSDAGLRAVAKELNVSAFVAGELSKKKAALTVRNGADGSVLGEDSFAGPNPKKIAALVGSTFWRQLGPAVRQGRPPSGAKTKAVIAETAAPPDEAAEEAAPPPPAEEKPPERKKKATKKAAEPPPEAEAAADESEAPKAKAKAAPAAESEEEPSAGGAALPALTVGVAGRALFRQLNYHQNMSGLPPYSLSPGPEVGVWLEAYPAAFATQGFASNIGVFGVFNQGFGVSSTTMSTPPVKLTTKFQDFMGGLKVRWPVNIFAPYLSVAYGAQNFKFESSGPSPVPSVAYKFIRLGLGTRADFGAHASADLGVAYLLVTDEGTAAGAIKSAMYFPGTTANGVDVGASFAYRFTKLLGARVGVDFRQYGLDFHATQSSVPLAGGATDRYITAWGGVEITLDGMGGGTSGDDDDEKEPAAAKGKKKAHTEDAAEEEGGAPAN
jgi:hypothetical protein